MVRFFLFCEERCLAVLDRRAPRLGALLRRYQRVIKYITAGGTAAVVDLGMLYALTDGAGLHYLLSATIAFLLAFGVSFTLQKFWTFGHDDMTRVHAELALYLAVAVVNLFVNAGLMYVFVEVVGIWYLFAQILTGATIACYGFLLYRHVIFKHRRIHAEQERGTDAK